MTGGTSAPTTRAERVSRIAELRDDGLECKEIAEQLGIAVSTVYGYLSDPMGEKDRERKARVFGYCRDCGVKVFNSGSKDRLPERCRSCDDAFKHERGRQRILDAIAEWVERFGTPPSAADWNPAQALRVGMAWKAERYVATGRKWPSVAGVQVLFGAWNAALNEAGYPPVSPGEYRDGRSILDVVRARPRQWSREKILAALARWEDEHGRLPGYTDWQPGRAGEYPNAATVARVFGRWSVALDGCREQRMGVAA
jgi:predicted Zn-ribbon and HTH transcriptional regulator